MKNLKRVLALIMVVALVFSLSVSALAFTDDAAITNEQAVNVLSELGVIKGYPDGSFRPTDPVTRAEMAKMITVILNKGVDDPAQFESGTTDLTDISWNWGKSYITYCYILNIIAGYGDGTFRPDDEVTVQEAAKMILVSLGFDVDQEGLEGVNWAVNANSLANQYDLYTGVDQSVNVSATRDTIAQMLYNMLKANTVQYNVNIYTGISTLIKNDETAIEKYFDCEILNGIIVANEYAALWGGVPLMEGRTEVLFYDKDATANGMFDIADINYVNGVFNNYISDILKISTGKDELGMWVSLIRNRTTKNVIGQVMLENDMMTVVEGGDGNFVDAIKAAGLRLSDGRYSLFVNGEIFKWESSNGYYNLPDDVNHPLNSNAYTRTTGTTTGTESYLVYNANLGKTLESIFGTEYKDMNGMTFRAIELNGDNYVDAIFVETETLTQVTKIETKGGAKHYTFAGLNMDYSGTGTAVVPDSTWSNYAAQSVKEDYIVTDATLAVDDYVLVTQVNETYYVEKVEFEALTVSVKSTADKSLTLKDTDSTSTTYKLSHIPVVNTIYVDDEIYNNVGDTTLLGDLITGNKYTFGFDSAGNVVMATEGEKKTDYALLNGMATTYGTNYTAQLFLEDSTTVTGGLGDFETRPIRPAATSVYTSDGSLTNRNTTPSLYTTSNLNDSASDYPLLVSYDANGSKYDLVVEVDLFNVDGDATNDNNVYTGGREITIAGDPSLRVTSNTVFFYRIQNGNKVNYYAYTDYTKAPTFGAWEDVGNLDDKDEGVTISAAFVEGSSTYLAAVFVQANKTDVTDATGKDYIYITELNSNDYDNKITYVKGLTIDEDGKVTYVSKMAFDDDYTSKKIVGQMWSYTSTSTEAVYKLADSAEDLETVSSVSGSYMYYNSGNSVVTYSSSKSNLYQSIATGDKYESLTGSNFEKAGLKKGDSVYVVAMADSTVTPFVMRTSAAKTDYTSDVVTTSNSYLVYNDNGDLIAYPVDDSYQTITGSRATLNSTTQDDYLNTIASMVLAKVPANGDIAFVTVDVNKETVTVAGDSGYSVGYVLDTQYTATSDTSIASSYVTLGDFETTAAAVEGTGTNEYNITAGVLTYGANADELSPSGKPAAAVIQSGVASQLIPDMTTQNGGSTFAGGTFYYVESLFGGSYTLAVIVY